MPEILPGALCELGPCSNEAKLTCDWCTGYLCHHHALLMGSHVYCIGTKCRSNHQRLLLLQRQGMVDLGILDAQWVPMGGVQ